MHGTRKQGAEQKMWSGVEKVLECQIVGPGEDFDFSTDLLLKG